MDALIVAGEASGDLHGSRLISAFKEFADIKFFGIGGESMQEAGCEIIFPSERLGILGFVEVAKKWRDIVDAHNSLMERVVVSKPAFAVLIDFPGFNISLARELKSKNIPVFYFITPQVWAWGRWRMGAIRKYFDHLFVILPFEEELFRQENIPATFVGHPLLDVVKVEGKLKRSDFNAEEIIAYLPGSRKNEIILLLGDMIKSFELRRKQRDTLGLIALHDEEAERFVQDNFVIPDGMKIVTGMTYEVLNVADAGVITSGTATLESAIIGLPMVVVYRLSTISYIIAKLLASVKNVSLVNIISGREVVPELVQRFTPEDIASKLDCVIKNREEIKSAYRNLRDKLGEKGVYRRVALEILDRV